MIDEVVKFFLGREHHWSIRISVLTFITALFCLIELTTGLVSIFINSQRVDLLLKLNSAIKASAMDKLSLEFLGETRRALLNRGPFPTFTFAVVAEALRKVFREVDLTLVVILISAALFFFLELLNTLYHGLKKIISPRKVITELAAAMTFSILMIGFLLIVGHSLSNTVSIVFSIMAIIGSIVQMKTTKIFKKLRSIDQSGTVNG